MTCSLLVVLGLAFSHAELIVVTNGNLICIR